MIDTDRKTSRISRTDTIRTRLLVAFVTIALLPIVALSTALAISGSQGSRQQAVQQLTTVVNYKETRLRSWIATIQNELGNVLVFPEASQNVHQVLLADPETDEYVNSYNKVQDILLAQASQSPNFVSFSLVSIDGDVILSTDVDLLDESFAGEPLLQLGVYSPYIAPPFYSTAFNETVILVAYPIVNQQFQPIGMLLGQARLTVLNDILNDPTGLGETGVTYLVGIDRTLLAGLSPEEQGRKVQSAGINAAFEGGDLSARAYANYRGKQVIGVYSWLPDLLAVIMAEQEATESTRESAAVMAVDISVGLASVLIAIFIALGSIRNIAAPIRELAENASNFASGNFDERASVYREDEVGVMAHTFNLVADQLGNLIANLEQRVADRTQELEVRTSYLEASAQVSQATASILNLDQLLERAVELIQESFDLYYVGLFLADEKDEWAILKSGTGEAGRAMLSRGHRLPIGRASMVGWSIANAQARITQQAREDVIRVPTPELPETRSEAAIPLRSRGHVLGAISVQSTRPNAFDDTSISVLQSMADQLAVAIENARLFSEREQALIAERRAYREQNQAMWANWLQAYPDYGFRTDQNGQVHAQQVWYPEMQEALQTGHTVQVSQEAAESEPGEPENKSALAIPINVRGTVIGVLDIRKSNLDEDWSDEEITFLENITEQLGIAVDSARLYAQTQQRAKRERLLGEISSHVRQSLDIESVLKTAVDEIYQVLDLDQLVIQLVPEESEEPSQLDQPTNGRSREEDFSPEELSSMEADENV